MIHSFQFPLAQKQVHFSDQKPITGNNPKTTQSYFMATNVESQAEFAPNYALDQQLILQSKYKKALIENSELRCQIQNYCEEIENLKNMITQLDKELIEKQDLYDKTNQLQHQNSTLLRQIHQLHQNYNNRINDLTFQLYTLKNSNLSQNTTLRPSLNTQSHLQTYNQQFFRPHANTHYIPTHYSGGTMAINNSPINSNYQIEKYKAQIEFYRQKIGDYDKRIRILEQANYSLEHEVKLNIEEKMKHNTEMINQFNLKMNVAELKQEVRQLRQLKSNKVIQRNVSVPHLRIEKSHSKSAFNKFYQQKKEIKGEKFTQMKHPQKYATKYPSQNPSQYSQNYPEKKQYKWKDLQQRINELRVENQKIHKHLHI